MQPRKLRRMSVAVRGTSILAMVVALILPGVAQGASAQRLIVQYHAGTSASQKASVRAQVGAKLVHRLRFTANTEVILATPATEARIRANPNVEAVGTDGIVTIPPGESLSGPRPSSGPVTPSSTNDPYYGVLWAIENTGQLVNGSIGTSDADIDGTEAWSESTGSGATVYVADTGIDYNHPDLAVNYAGGYDFVADDTDPMDEQYHGTHVSGTIAAAYNNNEGVAGVAPNAKLVMLRVLDANGSGYFSDTIDAVNYAGQRGARIFSASLGGVPDPTTTTMMCNAVGSYPNTLFTFAAGNGGSDGVGDNNDVTPNYPSNCPSANVIAVAASTQTDGRASFSNYGPGTVDVAAPGSNIMSTIPHTGWLCGGVPSAYCYLNGTSMATPQVAGEAALLVARYPAWSEGQIRSRILSTVDPAPAWSGMISTGGRINANAAVTPPPPTATTGGASEVAVTTASVSGTVNPMYAASSYRFDYGTTSVYGSSTPSAGAGAGTADVPVSATLTGLTANTTYHYRVVALRGGTVAAAGADQVFTTHQLPANTALPKITGTPTPGAVLTCSPGSWAAATSYTYQWLRDGAVIAGRTTTTLTPGSGDLGRQIACRVTAGNPYGSATATSAAVKIVDLAPPRLTGLKLNPKAFKSASSGASIVTTGKTGTVVTFSLSERATVTFSVETALPGRMVKGRCVAPTRANRKAKACTRYVVVRGTFKWSGKGGGNALRFTGRVNGRKLARGTYRLGAIARDPSGNLAAPVRATFTIK